ncbi:Tyrosine--tRNA ligase {ECO:0000256/RuleBase:RU361234} {ECO:0000256/RuleBase:RU361234}; AltName: Full=Tyrosyl-tRNA synthetase {ECO:0000256/RuleBase:RU361234} [Serendipita indica DSM 11827]|uniref:Tyrosine--tRNA ligase n=1 Tax=Serendipita indica (strain DSM 11827) TaxID=1109443 RepID=G4TAD7_SERID|nr:Tyrosine--tRNA ligase {ECO:0000256/RuleBase:RU361234} {ECO:0000256/RuleBase:RU361234}; AltName: Full=Tyrosyl-tRNA synthetase {ECO:0000256/RuleBase:RU361234} [Serendipita indica DSM 11827]CCA68297.1 probable tyrosyl-tRNA synthetase, mitochondrial precursor [Serendipita indica DSM 11827]
MVAQLTSQNLQEVVEKRKIAVYAGVDPSAASLHVGNLAVLITLLHFHLNGHKVISLIGGATGQVGDPGGRTTERDLMAQELVRTNTESITRQVENFFASAREYAARRRKDQESSPPTILNNASWHSQLSFLSFLRFPGKLVRVNSLLSRESIKARLDSTQGISFAEFTYQLLQAYDFWILHKEHDVSLQIGGSDQWGNIVSGVELIRREKALSSPQVETSDTPDQDSAYGLTIPLLTTSSGEKFGKSAGNAIWLDSKMTSIFDFYQFFVRVADADVPLYLQSLTLLSVEEIESICKEHALHPEKRIAQRKLAAEVTELIHGDSAAKGAQMASTILFEPTSHTALGDDLTQISLLLGAIGENHPRVRKIASEQLGAPLTKIASSLGLVASHGKARALLQAGGLYLNNVRVTQLDKQLEASDFMGNKIAILRAGKEEHLILELVSR